MEREEGRAGAREEAFWQRYCDCLAAHEVAEGVTIWYRRHVEAFIRHLRPRRLREATPAEIGEFLVRMHRRPDVEGWQVRQADRALQFLYQDILKLPWASDWSVPLPLEELAESVPSAAMAAENVFARWGPWAAPLERMVAALRYYHYAYPWIRAEAKCVGIT